MARRRKKRSRAGVGRRVKFHGAYGTKARARAKEKRTPGSYIERIRVRGQTRYAVLTRRSGR